MKSIEFAEFKYWEGFLNLAEQVWFEHKRLPMKSEYERCLEEMGGDKKSLSFLLGHTQYKKMLRDRGLYHAAGDSTLMPEQLAAITTYLNIADRRSLRLKLLDLGITQTQFNAWLKFPPFKEYLQKKADELFAEGLPIAHQALMQAVANGDVRAIKLYYDKYGFGADVQQGNAYDVKIVMARLIEVIQKHVRDPEVLKAIAKDFEVVATGGVIAPAIQGEIERGS